MNLPAGLLRMLQADLFLLEEIWERGHLPSGVVLLTGVLFPEIGMLWRNQQ